MQQHYANKKPDERLAVVSWWKWPRDEDRVGLVEAWWHRWRSQARLVSVDHDGEEQWNLERPSVCYIPCTSELLSLTQQSFGLATSWNLSSTCVWGMWPLCLRVYMCVSKIPFWLSSFLCARHVPKCQITQRFSVLSAIVLLFLLYNVL